MRNIKLTIAYDGTDYSGWQKQTDKKTVEGEIEKVLSEILKEEVDIKGSGRTDSGVHAIGQVANFKTDKNIGIDELQRGCNTMLPRDIAIVKIDDVGDSFDSRKSTKTKHYRYIVNNSEIHDALNKDREYQYKYKVNLENMKKAASYVLGEHDFTAFRSLGSSSKRVIQEIYRLDITTKNNKIFVDIVGSGFLYNMVRIVVGTLLEVGSGKLKPEVIKEMLETGDRKLGGKTVPAMGLYLVEVAYK